MREFSETPGELTAQQDRFVFLLASGLPPKAAAAGAGYASHTSVLKNKNVQAALKFVREQERQQIFVNRDKLTAMLFNAHANAANATEEIAAIRELGKLHDVYEQAKQDRQSQLHTAVQINHTTVQKLSDQDLLRIAELKAGDLSPAAIAPPVESYLEANAELVDDDSE
ncbi:MAG: hypothetical protein VW443_02405 [Pseudomonadales bacterium]